MAIFHFSIEVLKRTEGKSAVSAAAWRANQKLFDNRLGRTANMPKDKRVIFKKILAPPSTPPDLLDRGVLSNAVEATGRQRNSQLARIINAALPMS